MAIHPFDAHDVAEQCIKATAGIDPDDEIFLQDKMEADLGINQSRIDNDLEPRILTNGLIGLPSRGASINPGVLNIKTSSTFSDVRNLLRQNADYIESGNSKRLLIGLGIVATGAAVGYFLIRDNRTHLSER
jgi:hypothetical protein